MNLFIKHNVINVIFYFFQPDFILFYHRIVLSCTTPQTVSLFRVGSSCQFADRKFNVTGCNMIQVKMRFIAGT